MPLYEGIALIQEKQAVVLDLGTVYTKFGFTGEAAPRCIVPSVFWCAQTRQPRRVFDYNTPEELHENLVHMLHLLYFRHVLVNPKERKVVVVESLLTPTLVRETLARVLFTHYEVSGVVFAGSAQLCTVALGAPTALVVSLGWREAEVTAVVHGIPLTHALQAQPLAASAIHAELARLLDEDNGQTLNLSDHVLEDIKVKCCFVGPLERAHKYLDGTPPAPAPSVKYPLPTRAAITVSGRTRECAAEVMFARDADCCSLPDIVLQCIMQCPVDTRRPLAENILVTGGSANLPGVRSRLAAELRYLVATPRYSNLHLSTFNFHAAPARDNYCAWLGGALLGATDALNSRALSRDNYRRDQRVKDWVNLLDNTRPDHPHWASMTL